MEGYIRKSSFIFCKQPTKYISLFMENYSPLISYLGPIDFYDKILIFLPSWLIHILLKKLFIYLRFIFFLFMFTKLNKKSLKSVIVLTL